MSDAPQYVVIVTDEDDTESAYGPWSQSFALLREQSIQRAFPRARVRALALLTVQS